MNMRWNLLIFLSTCLITGCFNAGIPVRSADLPSPGNFSGHAQVSVATFAPGEVVASDGSVAQSTFGTRAHVFPEMLIPLYPVANSSLGLEVGLTDGVSLDFSLGPQQLGADLRLALLQQRDGQPVSLALAAGAAYRPFIEATTPWLLAGLDLSHRFTPVVFSTNLYASYGPESHVNLLSREQTEAVGASDYDEGAPPHYTLTRDELRFHLALSFGPALENTKDVISSTTEGEVSVGMAGYWTAFANEPDFMSCYSCEELMPFTMQADLGVTLVLSARFRGLD